MTCTQCTVHSYTRSRARTNGQWAYEWMILTMRKTQRKRKTKKNQSEMIRQCVRLAGWRAVMVSCAPRWSAICVFPTYKSNRFIGGKTKKYRNQLFASLREKPKVGNGTYNLNDSLTATTLMCCACACVSIYMPTFVPTRWRQVHYDARKWNTFCLCAFMMVMYLCPMSMSDAIHFTA